MKQRKTIAFLTSGIMDLFSILTSRGIMSSIAGEDVNLLIVPMKYINRERMADVDPYEYQYQTTTMFLKKENVDVLIVAADCIGCLTTRDNLERFMKSLGDIPVVLVASMMEGYAGVTYENESGIREGLNYLIEEMGVKKICMLGGFPGNSDAEQRFAVYKDVLAKHGLPFEERFFVEGPLSPYCRTEAARMLDRNPDAEAIFCVNDVVAFGLYAEMKDRGLEPGKDIYVLGFDNEPDSAMINPSLSTVDADAIGLGRYAGQMALRLLNGEKVGAETIPTRFIARDSFGGITAQEMKDLSNYLDRTKIDMFFKTLFYRYNAEEEKKDNSVLRKMFTDLMEQIISRVEKKQTDPDFDDPNSVSSVVADADAFVKHGAIQYADVDEFVSFLEKFHAAIAENLKNGAAREKATRVLVKVMKRVVKVLGNQNMKSSQQLNEMLISLKNLVRDSLNFIYGNDHSYAAIISHVEWLGIRNAYIYVFDRPIVHLENEQAVAPKTLRLKAALTDGKLMEIPYSDQVTRVEDLFSGRFMTKECYQMAMVPLFSGDTVYGTMLFDATELTFMNGDFLTNQFGTAVHMINILKQNNEIQKQLEDNLAIMAKNNIELDKLSRNDVLTGILNRRGFSALAESVIRDSREVSRDTVVAYVDMNNLKIINDRFGHDDGDFALKAVSQVLTKVVGEQGVVGRIGGDEYAFVYFGFLTEEQLKEKIRIAFEDFNRHTDKPYNVTVSCGFYRIGKDDEKMKLEDAMGMADQDLYIAKQTKDNRILKSM